jgi:hypothetical protein
MQNDVKAKPFNVASNASKKALNASAPTPSTCAVSKATSSNTAIVDQKSSHQAASSSITSNNLNKKTVVYNLYLCISFSMFNCPTTISFSKYLLCITTNNVSRDNNTSIFS